MVHNHISSKIIIPFFIGIIGLLGWAVWTTPASAQTTTQQTAGPEVALSGTFEGTAHGDKKSTADIAVAITANDDDSLTAEVVLGPGLKANAGGLCGTIAVPATSMPAVLPHTAVQGNQISGQIPLDVGGFTIPLHIDGTLTNGGQLLDIDITVETPSLCWYNPEISGQLVKQ